MKIGILTLHAQTNYGGVLQTYALQETLRSLGHEPIVIDRRLSPDDSMRKGIVASRSPLAWFKFAVRGLAGLGDFAHLIRCLKTTRFINKRLNLSAYSFYDWKDAPSDLGVDAMVIGSDQVWNPMQLTDRCAYLLEGAPEVSAIAYAASFGVSNLPEKLLSRYKDGMARFRMISSREKEATKLIHEVGCTAEHVADPVLLANKEVWRRLGAKESVGDTRRLFVYLIHTPFAFVRSSLITFANKERCEVDVYVGGPSTKLPHGPREFWLFVMAPILAIFSRRVHLKRMAAPDEFVRDLTAADSVVTDSFHGLMFASVFNKNVRVLTPCESSARSGFTRLSEFVEKFFDRSVLSDSVGSALSSLRKDCRICVNINLVERVRCSSLDWLKRALGSAR